MLVLLYFFSMILEKVKWDIFGWSCDLFTLLTPVYFVFLLFRQCRIRIGRVERQVIGYYFVLLAYLLLQFLFIKRDPTITVQYIKGVITTILQLVASVNLILIFNGFRDKLSFRYICRVIFGMALLDALYCVAQSINPDIDAVVVRLLGSTVSRYGLDSYGRLMRVTGFLLEPNFNGPFLTIGLIIGLYLFGSLDKGTKTSQKTGLLIGIALVGAMCLLTLSLTAYIGVIVYLFYLVGRSHYKHKNKLIFLMAVALVLLAGVYITNEGVRVAINAKMSFTQGKEALLTSSHVRIFLESMQIYFSDMRIVLFGTGINCLNVYFQRMFDYSMMKAHSYYVQYLCETGIFGIGIYLYYFVLLYKNATRSSEGKLLRIMIICSIMMNFTYDPFTRNYNLLFLLLMLINHYDYSDLMTLGIGTTLQKYA